jgi:hypothetical protein
MNIQEQMVKIGLKGIKKAALKKTVFKYMESMTNEKIAYENILFSIVFDTDFWMYHKL